MLNIYRRVQIKIRYDLGNIRMDDWVLDFIAWAIRLEWFCMVGFYS